MEILTIMGTFLEKITGAIGSASGSAAGSLVKDLSDGIGQFINTPEDKQKAQQYLLDNANKVQAELDANNQAMATIAEKEHEAEMADAASARENQTQIATSANAPLLDKITLPILALFVTAGFFGLLTYMLKYDIPESNKAIIFTMVGSLGTAWIGIIGYYFGTSRGSDNKNDTIKTLVQQNT